MKCPYVNDYECDNCMYCKIEPYKKGGLDNWNMLEGVEVTEISSEGIKNIKGEDFINHFDDEFLGNNKNGIVSDERTFEDGVLDGGLMPTSESLTRDFNRIFGTNYKNIFGDD